jgi:hypothetical protein
VLSIWHIISTHLIQNLCTRLGGAIYIQLFKRTLLHRIFIFLTLFVLASITKKGEIVSAINPKWGFWWFNDKTNKGTNVFVPTIYLECTGTKGSSKDIKKHHAGSLQRTSCDGRIKLYVNLELHDIILPSSFCTGKSVCYSSSPQIQKLFLKNQKTL